MLQDVLFGHDLGARTPPCVDGGKHVSQELFLTQIVRSQRIGETNDFPAKLVGDPFARRPPVSYLPGRIDHGAQPPVVLQKLCSNLAERHGLPPSRWTERPREQTAC